MDLDECITLTTQDGNCQLPLKNLLRLTLVYMQKMLPEYYEQTTNPSVKDYWIWVSQKLDLKKGDSVLL